MKVPLLDLAPQVNSLREELLAAMTEVVDSQRFIMGDEVLGIERDIAEYCNVEHAIGVSSGSDALLLALMALGIGRGDAVITTPYTFFATGGAIARVGATPIFCDIDMTTYNLSPRQVEQYLSDNCEHKNGCIYDTIREVCIKAIMPVHLYGQTADMLQFSRIAEQHKLFLIEDAAQAIGAESEQGRRAGSIGHIGCYSFFPSKNLGAFGDGGMCVTTDEGLAERMRVLRVHGGKPKYHHQIIGGNFRLDTLHAAVLQVKLPHLDSWTKARQENAARYNKLFSHLDPNILRVPCAIDGARHIYNQYVLRTPHRDQLRAHLSEKSIGSEIYYPIPLHSQECFSYLGYSVGAFPNSEAAAKETVAIPIYPELGVAQLEYVATTISEFLGSRF